jgi:hypothetical protein
MQQALWSPSQGSWRDVGVLVRNKKQVPGPSEAYSVQMFLRSCVPCKHPSDSANIISHLEASHDIVPHVNVWEKFEPFLLLIFIIFTLLSKEKKVPYPLHCINQRTFSSPQLWFSLLQWPHAHRMHNKRLQIDGEAHFFPDSPRVQEVKGLKP